MKTIPLKNTGPYWTSGGASGLGGALFLKPVPSVRRPGPAVARSQVRGQGRIGSRWDVVPTDRAYQLNGLGASPILSYAQDQAQSQLLSQIPNLGAAAGPGGAFSAAALAFAQTGDPKAAANAAFGAACAAAAVAASAGIASPLCAVATVDNMAALSQALVSALPAGWQAHGVAPCYFAAQGVMDQSIQAYNHLQDSLDVTWHATRAAMKLAAKPSPFAVVVPAIPAIQSGPDAAGLYHTTPAVPARTDNSRFAEILADDPLFSRVASLTGTIASAPGTGLPTGFSTSAAVNLKLPAQTPPKVTLYPAGTTMPNGDPGGPLDAYYDNCNSDASSSDIASRATLLAQLHAQYRLVPAAAAAKQVALEMADMLAKEKAGFVAKAPVAISSKAMTLLRVKPLTAAEKASRAALQKTQVAAKTTQNLKYIAYAAGAVVVLGAITYLLTRDDQ